MCVCWNLHVAIHRHTDTQSKTLVGQMICAVYNVFTTHRARPKVWGLCLSIRPWGQRNAVTQGNEAGRPRELAQRRCGCLSPWPRPSASTGAFPGSSLTLKLEALPELVATPVFQGPWEQRAPVSFLWDHPGDKLEPFQDPFLSDGAAPPPLAGLLSPVFSLLVRGPGLPEGGGRLSRVAHRDVNGLR